MSMTSCAGRAAGRPLSSIVLAVAVFALGACAASNDAASSASVAADHSVTQVDADGAGGAVDFADVADLDLATDNAQSDDVQSVDALPIPPTTPGQNADTGTQGAESGGRTTPPANSSPPAASNTSPSATPSSQVTPSTAPAAPVADEGKLNVCETLLAIAPEEGLTIDCDAEDWCPPNAKALCQLPPDALIDLACDYVQAGGAANLPNGSAPCDLVALCRPSPGNTNPCKLPPELFTPSS